MTDLEILAQSRALWNRSHPDLDSDEVLAQILERGELEVWRALYRIASRDEAVRVRIGRLVREVPLPMPFFWLAALASLGERVDWTLQPPRYGEAPV